MDKDIDQMTRAEFDALPYRQNWAEQVECTSIVILPTRKRHDSGYRAMDFVAVDARNKPICRLAGGSDVLCIGGIGGYNREGIDTLPSMIKRVAWSIDCLPTSGLLHLYVLGSTGEGKMVCGAALSSFELFYSREE